MAFQAGYRGFERGRHEEDALKAIVQDQYGLPRDVLKLEEIDKPAVADDEVLVRISAASIHIGDFYVMKGVPYMMRPVVMGSP